MTTLSGTATGNGRSAHIATGDTLAPTRIPRPTAVITTGTTGTIWSTGSPATSSVTGTGAMKMTAGTMTAGISIVTTSGSGMTATMGIIEAPASTSTRIGEWTVAGSSGTTGTIWSTGSPTKTGTTPAPTTTEQQHIHSVGSLPIGKGASSLTPVSDADQSVRVERANLTATKPAQHSDGTTGKLYSNFPT